MQRILKSGPLPVETEERRRALEDLTRKEQRVEQLMNRFSSLMDERRYFDAEAVADLARDLAPNRPAIMAAMHNATKSGYWAESEALRQAGARGMVDTLQTVERSHIPTPDEPPIVYPDKEFWIASRSAARSTPACRWTDQSGREEDLQGTGRHHGPRVRGNAVAGRDRLLERLPQDRDSTG